MAETMATTINRPAWVDLSSADPTASRAFYARLFDWQIEVSPDPQWEGQMIVVGKTSYETGDKALIAVLTARVLD